MSRIIAVVFILGVFAFAGYSNRGFIKHFHEASTASEKSNNKETVAPKTKPSEHKNARKDAKANSNN